MGDFIDKLKKLFDKTPEVVAQVTTVGPYDANKADNIGEEAFKVSDETKLPGRHNGKRDAFRHAYLSCKMTKDLGEDQAEKVGNVHEIYGENPPEETAMDLKNNSVGRQLAKDPKDCKASVWDALGKGELQTAPAPVAGPPKITY